MPGLRRWRLATVVCLAACLAVAASGLYLTTTVHSAVPSEGPAVVADGPTFDQAYVNVSSQTNEMNGGPWALFSVYGIAARLPFSPNVLSYPSNNATINGCGHAFNGLTIWNGSIPLFNGTFDSGTAPFWQFGFYSAATNQALVATDVNWGVKVYPAFTPSGSCYPWYDYGRGGSYWSSLMSPLPVDTSIVARAASELVTSERLPVNNSAVEIYTSGPGMFSGLGDLDGGFGVYFDHCGVAGVAGLQPVVQIGFSPQGQWEETANLTTNCAVFAQGHGVYDGLYKFVFSGTTSNSSAGTNWTAAKFQVNLAYPNGTLTSDWDAWGLANWMTFLNLTNASGPQPLLAPSSCASWVSTLSDCPSNAPGWFAVLTSSYGEWIDSYGMENGTPRWANPVDGIASNQSLVIVTPTTWNVAGSTLSVGSTTNESAVSGSTVL